MGVNQPSHTALRKEGRGADFFFFFLSIMKLEFVWYICIFLRVKLETIFAKCLLLSHSGKVSFSVYCGFIIIVIPLG